MRLSVAERLMTQNLLPEKGTFTNLRLVRVAREALSFSDEENKALEFKQEGEQLFWNNTVISEANIELGEVVTEMIKKELKALNDKEELTPQHVSLYSKFVEAAQ